MLPLVQLLLVESVIFITRIRCLSLSDDAKNIHICPKLRRTCTHFVTLSSDLRSVDSERVSYAISCCCELTGKNFLIIQPKIASFRSGGEGGGRVGGRVGGWEGGWKGEKRKGCL